MARTILVIDDERNIRWVLVRALQKAGYDVLTAERGDQGLQLFARHPVDLVLLDLRMPGMDGLAVLRELRQRNTTVPILLLTAYATVPTAVEALQLGASDYLRKPFDLEMVLSQISRHLVQRAEEASQQEKILPSADFSGFIGAAPALTGALASAKTAAQTDYTVLILGDEGTGRQHLGQLIHASSSTTARGRLVHLDCARLPIALLTQELLDESGEDPGMKGWQGALGGSLLLANVNVLDKALIVPLVNHLLDYMRSTRRPHGLRLILTASAPLTEEWAAVCAKAISIQLPPLQARMEDLPLLIMHFAPQATWSREARAVLEGYTWPGNVAELRRVVQQATSLAGDEPVQPHHLPSQLTKYSVTPSGVFVLPAEGVDLEGLEQDLIRQALTMAQGNKTHAARLLGLSRATLLYRLDKYGIDGTK